jgi:hypothetical protein
MWESLLHASQVGRWLRLPTVTKYKDMTIEIKLTTTTIGAECLSNNNGMSALTTPRQSRISPVEVEVNNKHNNNNKSTPVVNLHSPPTSNLIH